MTNMLDYSNWVFWKKEWVESKGKFTKYPMNPNVPGTKARTNDPSTWADWATVRSLYDLRSAICPDWDGIGFVLNESDPFIFIDIDGLTTGDEVADHIVAQFTDGAFIERSMSGTGLHIITVGQHGGEGYYQKNGKFEAYDTGRFVAMTFDTIRGDVQSLSDNQTGVDLFLDTHMLRDESGGKSTGKYHHKKIPWDKGPDPEWDGPTDDDELIALMVTDFQYNMGRKHLIAPLWNGDQDALMSQSEKFIKPSDNSFDWSSADLSLMNAIADFTGDDPMRMDRLFRKSALYREKRWLDGHENYKNRTIAMALNRNTKYRRIYKKPVEKLDAGYSTPPPMTPGQAKYGRNIRAFAKTIKQDLLTPEDQIKLFEGCVHVESRNEIFTPDGVFRSKEQFTSGMFAGHQFIIDAFGKTTTSPWEAFTQNRAVQFPKVDNMVFRPDLPQGVIDLDGEEVLNSYVKANVHKVYGADVSRFTGHLEKMFPDHGDREIITSYMAAVIQYPGIKFQWCPVIQGTEGNGKSMLIRAIRYAVGDKYAHSVNSASLADGGGKFNKWLEGKLFIDFEEIYTADRRDVMEILKPIVTDSRLEIQGKGSNQYTGDNRANCMMASNHKDAIIKTDRDRRYAILYTAQQSAEDCIRDGMGGNYFPDLYNWLNAGGYAEVAGWLETYPIPHALNPAKGCQRAPVTSCRDEAISNSLSPVEQYITEWVDAGRPGFAGGWISSVKLDEALKEVGMAGKVYPRRRKTILEALGYFHHPGLYEGRSPIEMMEEGNGKRPKLFVKKSNGVLWNLADPPQIASLYRNAQGYQTVA